MDDFYDDFIDDKGEFMDDDSDFDENLESEDSLDDGPEFEDESTDDVCDDEFTMEDAIVLGGTMLGLAYEEGLEEAERRKLEKKMDDDRNNLDREDGI